jgi:hypothetical protein
VSLGRSVCNSVVPIMMSSFDDRYTSVLIESESLVLIWQIGSQSKMCKPSSIERHGTRLLRPQLMVNWFFSLFFENLILKSWKSFYYKRGCMFKVQNGEVLHFLLVAVIYSGVFIWGPKSVCFQLTLYLFYARGGLIFLSTKTLFCIWSDFIDLSIMNTFQHSFEYSIPV